MTFEMTAGRNIRVWNNRSGPETDKVPGWTIEDEDALVERVKKVGLLRALYEPDDGRDIFIGHPPTQLSFTATLGIAKRHRATCPSCRMRRVLFAIVATGNLFGGSEPRCARCWGLR